MACNYTVNLHKTFVDGWNEKIPNGNYIKPRVFSCFFKSIDVYHVPHKKSKQVNINKIIAFFPIQNKPSKIQSFGVFLLINKCIK